MSTVKPTWKEHLLPIASSAWVNDAENYTINVLGIGEETLMETAGQSCFALFQGLSQKSSICVLAGGGKNGGDGLVFARYAFLSGIDVHVVLVLPSSKKHTQLQKQCDVLDKLGVSYQCISSEKEWRDFEAQECSVDWVVDALLGLGIDREVEGLYRHAVLWTSTLKDNTGIFSIDVPSGLHPDRGMVMGCAVEADITASLSYLKPGFFQLDGPAHTGDVFLIPLTITSTEPVSTHLLQIEVPMPQLDTMVAHKGDKGRAGIFAGSPSYSGAAILSSLACHKSNVGLTTLAIGEDAHDITKEQLIDVMSISLSQKDQKQSKKAIQKLVSKQDAFLVGPGIELDQWSSSILDFILEKVSCSLVIDAGALKWAKEHLAQFEDMNADVVMTPHPGEMAMLMDTTIEEVQNNRIETARAFSKRYQVWLVLKGPFTVIAAPDSRVWLNPTGDQTLSVGGSGDVLAGMITANLAQGMSTDQALCLAVWFHGQIGEMRGRKTNARAIMASELLPMIEQLYKEA